MAVRLGKRSRRWTLRHQDTPSPRGKPKSRFFAAASKIAKRLEPNTARAFLRTVQRVQNQIDEAVLRQAITGGNLSLIEAAAGSGKIPALLAGDTGLYNALHGASTATGAAGAEILEEATGLTVRFNAVHPDVVRAAREQIGDLIVQVDNDVKEAVRIVVSAGAELGLTVDQQARAIREVVGLPPNWARAPVNLGAELRDGRFTSSRRLSAVDKAKIKKRLKDGTVDEDFVEEMQTRYSQSLVNRRAMNIARTETLRASYIGQQQGWRQAISDKVLPSDVKRYWIITPDSRLEHHMVPGMNPNGRGMEELFDTPEGMVLHPPSRPNCRCGVGLLLPGGRGVI